MRKVRKVLGAMLVLAIGLQYASAGFCLQKPKENLGYCAEELGGRGVCVVYKPNNTAQKDCVRDQPHVF